MAYTKEDITELVKKQRAYFRTNQTLDVNWRIQQLKKLKKGMRLHEKELTSALTEDLGRTEAEGFLADIGSVIMEIDETVAGLRRWAKPETHLSGIVCFPSIITKVYSMPYGTVLIISPFNFPFMLSLGVLTAAIAGGNTAIIKASSKSPACTRALKKMIEELFNPEYISVVDGGHDVADICLEERFDKIFYTGSPKVAKHILEMAAKNLTPVALELGGETGNWAIIRKDADIRDAARKIVFFKSMNSGQICININQVAVASEVAEKFIEALKAELIRQLGEKPLDNPEYTRLINDAAYLKCADEAMKYREHIVIGGHGNPETRKFEPTVLYPVSVEEHAVNHELFCPLLPVVPYEDDEIEKLLGVISSREKGLALYLFTKDIPWAKRTMQTMQYGGGCVNEVCVHLMVKGVPFNGTGHSGMGAYHGKWGFKEFTHPQTVLYGNTHFNLSLREHPYTGKTGDLKLKMLHIFER